MDPLSHLPDFKFLPYTAAPQSSLPPLSLKNTSTWTYSGPLLPLTPTLSSLPPSFHTWSLATLSPPSALPPRLLPFLTHLHDFLTAANVSHYWLTIRATKPTDEYDVVRWHTDDIFFDEETREEGSRAYWKLATTLLGPPTLFLKDGKRARKVQRRAKREAHERGAAHVCSSFRCLGCNEAVEAVRRRLAVDFADEEVARPRFGEVAFFRLGDREGAVHSEPRCGEDRIFVNVVPGSEGELRGLMRKWGLEYPRAWSFGVPFCYDEEVGRDGKDVECSRRSAADIEKRTDGQGKEVGLDVQPLPRSTMSLSLGEEYRSWLEKKGLKFGSVFGLDRLDKLQENDLAERVKC